MEARQLGAFGGQALQLTGELVALLVQLGEATAQQFLVLQQQPLNAAAGKIDFGLLGLYHFRFVGVGARQSPQVPLQAVQFAQLVVEQRVFNGSQGRNTLLHGLVLVAGQAVLARHLGHLVQKGYFDFQLRAVQFELFELRADGRHRPLHVVHARALHESLDPVLRPLQALAVLVQNLVQKTKLLAHNLRLAG